MSENRTETPYLIAFLTLNGFTAQCTRVTDAELAGTLDEYFALGVGSIEGSGGRVVKFMGDGILAVFESKNVDSGVLGLLALKSKADDFFLQRHWDCSTGCTCALWFCCRRPTWTWESSPLRRDWS